MCLLMIMWRILARVVSNIIGYLIMRVSLWKIVWTLLLISILNVRLNLLWYVHPRTIVMSPSSLILGYLTVFWWWHVWKSTWAEFCSFQWHLWYKSELYALLFKFRWLNHLNWHPWRLLFNLQRTSSIMENWQTASAFCLVFGNREHIFNLFLSILVERHILFILRLAKIIFDYLSPNISVSLAVFWSQFLFLLFIFLF